MPRSLPTAHAYHISCRQGPDAKAGRTKPAAPTAPAREISWPEMNLPPPYLKKIPVQGVLAGEAFCVQCWGSGEQR